MKVETTCCVCDSPVVRVVSKSQFARYGCYHCDRICHRKCPNRCEALNRGRWSRWDEYRKAGLKPQSKEMRQRWKQEYKRKTKDTIFSHYGKSCACCGESGYGFLSIDHINGGGNKHRNEIKRRSGTSFYRWLIVNDFPEGFQTLCYNCNLAKGFIGRCPHEESRVSQLVK